MPTFHALSALKWGASRARAPPLRIVSALFPQSSFFHLRRVLLQCPSSTQTLEKQADLVGLALFRIFRIFRFFRSFFPFFPFFRFSDFSVFSVFWARFRGNRPPAQCVFSYPSFPPKLKATHPKRPNAVENATMRVNCCCWLPPSSPSMPTQMCCVSARRPQDAVAKGRRR